MEDFKDEGEPRPASVDEKVPVRKPVSAGPLHHEREPVDVRTLDVRHLLTGSPAPEPRTAALDCVRDQKKQACLNGNANERALNRGARQETVEQVYGALDLGTNNCRLLLARPTRRGFRVVDSFSRIIRLGEGVSQCGTLSEPAMRRTMDALKVCGSKLNRHGVRRARLVATEACRFASNGPDFLARVKERLGLDIEVLTPEVEARLAVSGCASLIDDRSDYVLVFDIGGGSSELIWLNLSGATRKRSRGADRIDAQNHMAAWTSLPVGVVTLAERFGGRFVTSERFEAMVEHVSNLLRPFEDKYQFAPLLRDRPAHLLGTSGTVTTIAGIQMGLPRYDRNRVDGCWLSVAEARDITYKLVGSSYEERVAQPCIGRDRADLVLAGCAILEALIRLWPCERLRVADRGLREGILTTLMIEDGVYRTRRRRGRQHR
ncbi:putative Guanosine-5'-triphosphate,3'-diphosphate diphosphatase [Candidatus Filomicrobium marinum]|uniref:Putative Guanosine-5'-triphosphate,3'-diphosphate diphosphatase n=1 Tax=Candidatus Filomicrobium marinum TaxID=1608628 RepID=A0A0D6JFM8_9HYPH|nr:Ppx/GppA phosphatase family protein [Candidatus Filomicrobium marinum]CFX28053.1 putative Guanosine-5'-triphosphate,3'-diphosphate diphosphatase [Candidatus Filomicrobium marinum]CPR19637.1 putative Guanosine-5'-triphosphate,3'-diphosphate diphosphatase [Candidatus Filomicrobium marinum]